jgi:hypothetical protein
MRQVIVVSNQREIANSIGELRDKIPLNVETILPVREGSDTPDLQFKAYGDVFRAPDLVLVDEAYFGSRQSVRAYAETIRREQRFNGCAIILVTRQLVSDPQTDSLLPPFDAVFPIDALVDNRHLLIRSLYGRAHSGNVASGTRMVWKLMEARASGIALGSLFGLLRQENVSAQVGVGEITTAASIRKLNAEFLRLAKLQPFSLTLAERLLKELPSLLWTYIVESLIDNGLCELEGIGIFQKSYSAQLSVLFTAGSVISGAKLPDMLFNTEEVDSLPMRICRQNAIPYAYELLASKIPGDITHYIFAQAIPEVVNSVVTAQSATDNEMTADDIWGSNWKSNSWAGVLSRAVAFATYYLLTVSYAQSVHNVGEKEIPEVGKFVYDPQRIKFEASPALLDLIAANPQAQSFTA